MGDHRAEREDADRRGWDEDETDRLAELEYQAELESYELADDDRPTWRDVADLTGRPGEYPAAELHEPELDD